jgi:sulfite exporter TauE/SafE
MAATMRAVRKSRVGRSPFLGSVLMGAALGLLPCVLMFWTLGIAATTASPLHGAGVMVTLVLLTTPTLLAAGCAASIWRIKWSERAVGVVLLMSSAWMLLVALAANDVISHAEVMFKLGGDPYMIMFF